MEALRPSIDEILSEITDPAERAEKAAFLEALWRPALTMTALNQGEAVVMPTEAELNEMASPIRDQAARSHVVEVLKRFYVEASVVTAEKDESRDLL